jgi:hypothetical protein
LGDNGERMLAAAVEEGNLTLVALPHVSGVEPLLFRNRRVQRLRVHRVRERGGL